MKTPYDELKSTREWKIIKKALKDLVKNQDIEISTHPDYVIGYLTRKLISGDNTNPNRTKNEGVI